MQLAVKGEMTVSGKKVEPRILDMNGVTKETNKIAALSLSREK